MHGVRDRRGDRHDAGFAGACRRRLGVSDKQRLDRRRVVAARHPVAREARVQHATRLEVDRLIQRGAHALHDRPFNLVLCPLRVDDETAIERRRHAMHAHLRPLHVELHACRDVAADIEADGNALAGMRRGAAPAMRFSRTLQHAPEAGVREVAKPQFDGVDARRSCDLVHVYFSREMVRCSTERAIRARGERAVRRIRRDLHIRHGIRCLRTAAA